MIQKKWEKEIKNLILGGEFLEAKKNLHEISHAILRDLLLEIGYDEESICAYSFICFLMINHETVEFHCLASEIMNNAFPHLPGGYETSLYHIRRAVELELDDIELEENLLFYNSLPHKLVDDEEARKIAEKVLIKKPTSITAKRILAASKKV